MNCPVTGMDCPQDVENVTAENREINNMDNPKNTGINIESIPEKNESAKSQEKEKKAVFNF